jgi:plasmid maintenance system antidote protein VapI
MKSIELIKGLHPGVFLERELKARNLAKGPFALSIGEYPQTLGAITKGKRNMNTALSLKIEKVLGLEEGLLMSLQVFYDIKLEKQKVITIPDLSNFNKAIFWDTNIDKIDWVYHKKFVIDRVMERGGSYEKKEIKKFYNIE